MYQRCYEVVGYTHDADVYCPECAAKIDAFHSESEEFGPIFCDSEWDYDVHCSCCHEFMLNGMNRDDTCGNPDFETYA